MPSHPLRVAVEGRDLEALIDVLAPEIVFWSPLISTPFEGRERVGDLLRILADEFLFTKEFHYTTEIADGDTVALGFQSRLKGKDVAGVDLLLVDDQNRIREMTVFMRPLSGAAAVAQALAPRLAGQGKPGKTAMVGLGTGTLSAMTRIFDALASSEV